MEYQNNFLQVRFTDQGKRIRDFASIYGDKQRGCQLKAG